VAKIFNQSAEKKFFQIIYENMLKRSQSNAQPLYLNDLIDRMNLKELNKEGIREEIPRFTALKIYYVSKDKGYISIHVEPDSENIVILLTLKGLEHLRQLSD
jgi:hypothetical protein